MEGGAGSMAVNPRNASGVCEVRERPEHPEPGQEVTERTMGNEMSEWHMRPAGMFPPLSAVYGKLS